MSCILKIVRQKKKIRRKFEEEEVEKKREKQEKREKERRRKKIKVIHFFCGKRKREGFVPVANFFFVKYPF